MKQILEARALTPLVHPPPAEHRWHLCASKYPAEKPGL